MSDSSDYSDDDYSQKSAKIDSKISQEKKEKLDDYKN